MREYLLDEMNKMRTKIFALYDFHNTPRPDYHIDMALSDLRITIEKKLNFALYADKISNFSRRFSEILEKAFKFNTKEELEKNLRIIPNFNTVIDKMVLECQEGLLYKSFQEDYLATLKEIFKFDNVYDSELRINLQRYFRIESDRLEAEIRGLLDRFILQNKNLWIQQLDEKINKTRVELREYEENEIENVSELNGRIDSQTNELDKSDKEEEKNKEEKSDFMHEYLISEMNKMRAKIFSLYNFHNTPRPDKHIDMALSDLSKNIEKKLNFAIYADKISNFSSRFSEILEKAFKFSTKEELEKNLRIIPNFNIVIDKMVLECQEGLLHKSFQEDYLTTLKEIFQSNNVSTPELRFDLANYLKNESNRLEVEIRGLLDSFILQNKNLWIQQLDEKMNKTRLELSKYEENEIENVSELNGRIDSQTNELDKSDKEGEKNKEVFLAEREKQREKDKIDRSKQIEARKMVYSNEEYQLEEKGKSL